MKVYAVIINNNIYSIHKNVIEAYSQLNRISKSYKKDKMKCIGKIEEHKVL